MTELATNSPESERPQLHHLLGTAALLFAAAILFLALIDRSAQLTFMPSSWYSHRVMWYFLGVVSFVGSVLLLKSPAPESASAGSSADVRFRRVVLYTKQECPLCDEAKQTLDGFRRFLPPVEVRDIEDDPELIEKFCDCVPVVKIDDRIRFRGRVNETLLRRLIDGATARSDDRPS